MELIMPLFTGVLCSLFFCAAVAVSYGFFMKTPAPLAVENKAEDDINLLFSTSEDIPDPVLEYFHNDEYREWVIEFFAGLCSSKEIAMAILYNTAEFEVPPALAFALCWEESRFNPYAVNRRNRDGSIDRGLFQLNSRSFPDLETSAFLSVNSNAYHGVKHLRYCLNSGDSEVSALAMYNAGAGRVRSTGAPEVTLNYISRILENRRKIESRFHSRLIMEEESRMTEKEPQGTFQFQFNRALMTASPL
jgi:hypothetical protein